MVKAQRSQPVKCGKLRKEKGSKEKGGRVKKGKERKNELRGRKKKDKKEFHRRRKKAAAGGDGDALDCCVLLTRLEEKRVLGKEKDAQKSGKQKRVKVKKKHSSATQRRTKSGVKKTSNQHALEPKTKQSDALLASPVFEPRRRRMASLNAEAVNSLLLYRDDSQASNPAKKRQPSAEEKAKDILAKTEHRGHKTKTVPPGGKADPKERAKKTRRSAAEAQDIDWLALFAPTPRRQAGLTAATLLRLTSAQYGAKRQKKSESKPAAAATQGEAGGKPACGEAAPAQKPTHPKRADQLKHAKQGPGDLVGPRLEASVQGCCSLCKSEALAPEWDGSAGAQERLRRELRRGSSSLGFSLKAIKKEQVEADVAPCYCCSQDRCVEYCHRLALFLEDKTFKEPEDGTLSEVFHHHHHHHHHHHLQAQHAVSHPAAITISPHSYACFPGYYVHFSHPDASPAPIPPPPPALCPKSGKRAKLLPGAGPQTPGLGHPVYCCTSVEACYGEPCRIKSYSSYTSVVPAIGRGGCSFSAADCTKCSRGAERDDYPSTLNNRRSSPSVSASHAAGQSVARIQTPPPDPGRPQSPLQVAKECPQSAKSPSGSRSGARGPVGVGAGGLAARPLDGNKKQKLAAPGAGGRAVAKQPKNGRQKSTNGWQPVGLPFQKEVFSVGEAALVLRKCFEGVQRDGELIRVRDTVLLKSGPRKKSLPYVAKISALWEEPESGELMMSLFWYYRPEHTQGGRIPSIHCENEIFASRHQDVNSVACIEDKCYVLTLAQYCRFCALVKRHREGVRHRAASFVVPPIVGDAMPTHHCVPDDVDPELVFFCRHVYDFRYGRLLKNLQ
ncbi:bromo adjacent homology domain-containing 1 protein [Pungitius pungitius]|uniref:bromo adjacent homology domain-containing 1 protein n=1 Tax=Pungitius pungitius TaxID=134920 RepID=UPI002E120E52